VLQPEKFCDASRSKLPPTKTFQVVGSKIAPRLMGDGTCEEDDWINNNEDTAMRTLATADNFKIDL
jgi:hypothetical protein